MEYRIFTIPINDDGSAAAELNQFLGSRRVLSVSRELVNQPQGACWTFCVEYLGGNPRTKGRSRRQRVDYKEVLDDATFQVFARMRRKRKELAQAEGIPAYAICTDAQLAAMAQLDELSVATMKTVDGIGEAKAEKYGTALVAAGKGADVQEKADQPEATP